MKKLFLLLCLSFPFHLNAQVTSPESVKSGEAIHFSLQEDEEGCEAVWTVLNPFGDVTVTEIRPNKSNDLIVDPPCGWSGPIRVQVIVLDAEQRVKDIRVVVVQVGSPDKPVDPPNPPPIDDESDQKPDYDGLNDTGMGAVSYENCPKDSPYSDSVADLMARAAGHLRGYDGLKVIKSVGLRAGTDYELYFWLDKQMQSYPKEWQDWYSACEKYREEMGVGVGSPINMHWQMLQEMEAGIRGQK